MTEVVQSEFFESVQDERYNVLSEHKIAIDGSSSSILISKKPAWNMGGSSNGVVNAVSGKQCQFRVFSSSDIRSYLPYFAILVKGHASKTVNGAEVSVNYNQVGIDWDACGTLIKNAYIRFNGNSALAETYQNSRYNVSHKLRMLTTLSRQMIEGDSSIFFTPCIESGRELKTGLTPECAARGRRWLSSETTANTAGGIVYHTRMFPLSHVFACCAIPGFSKLNIIDIVVEWSRTDQILFQTSTDTNQNNYIIDDVSIVVDQTKLSAPQASIELKEQRSGRDVQRSAYSYYEICQQSYVQNAKLIVPTCENLQGVIFTFPSTADNNGINSTQFR